MSRLVPRILVVDDEPLISMMVANWLAELGYEVAGPARSVKEGLALVATTELDGAILDVNLAGEKSYQVAEALKVKQVPIAFATGDGRIDAGYPDAILLSKPFDFGAVKEAVEILLRERQAT